MGQMPDDFTFVWVAEGEIMTGQPRHYARAIEECYYGGYDLGDLFVIVVDEDNAIPVILRAEVRKQTLYGGIDTFHGRLYVTEPGGFVHEADYRLDLRA